MKKLNKLSTLVVTLFLLFAMSKITEAQTTWPSIGISALSTSGSLNLSTIANTDRIVYVNQSGYQFALPNIVNSTLTTDATGKMNWTPTTSGSSSISGVGQRVAIFRNGTTITTYPGRWVDTAFGIINDHINGSYYIGTSFLIGENIATNNLFIGFHAGDSSTNSAQHNTYVGIGAGTYNRNAGDNTLVGYNAGHFIQQGGNNNGNYNTAFGSGALYSNRNSSANTAIGGDALGAFNPSNGSGGHTAVGQNALPVYLTGFGMTAIGEYSGYHQKSGSYCTYIGELSGSQDTVGVENVDVGHMAGGSRKRSFDVTNTGSYAGDANNPGDYTTTYGYKAGTGFITCPNSMAIGPNAVLNPMTSVSNSLFLGPSAGQSSGNNITNATAIGYLANVTKSKSLILGATGANQVTVGIGTTGPDSKYLLHANGLIRAQNLARDVSLCETITSTPANFSNEVDGLENFVLFDNIIKSGDTVMLRVKITYTEPSGSGPHSFKIVGYDAAANSYIGDVVPNTGWTSYLVGSEWVSYSPMVAFVPPSQTCLFRLWVTNSISAAAELRKVSVEIYPN